MSANSYSSLCDDFYVDMHVNTELELPRGRDTILTFFERIQKQFPQMGRFYRRDKNEYYLEEEHGVGQYRWVSLEGDRIGSGMVNPASFQDAYDLDRLVLELMPYMLGVTSLDVDSLDLTPYDEEEEHYCYYWLFTADHEATYIDPATGQPLDPGDIYWVFTPIPSGAPTKLIDAQIHLGLPDGVDIDAFEMVLMRPPAGGPLVPVLAIVFSVDEDDPATAIDETGGLNPKMIYYSYLTGVSWPLLTANMADDVDALTAWEEDIGPPPVPPVVLLWRSIRTHGTVDWPIVLDQTATGAGPPGPTVESRTLGPQKIEVHLNRSITMADITLPIAAVRLDAAGPNVNATVNLLAGGSIIELTYAAGAFSDTACYRIDLAVPIPIIAGDTDVDFRTCWGDGNNNGAVDIGDVGMPNAGWLNGWLPNAVTFRFDYNCNGSFDIGDVGFANLGWRAAKSITCP